MRYLLVEHCCEIKLINVSRPPSQQSHLPVDGAALQDFIDQQVRVDLFKMAVHAHNYVFALPEILRITKELWADYDLMMTCQPPSFDQLEAFTINEVESR